MDKKKLIAAGAQPLPHACHDRRATALAESGSHHVPAAGTQVCGQPFHDPAGHLFAVRSAVAEIEPMSECRHVRRMRHHQVERLGA